MASLQEISSDGNKLIKTCYVGTPGDDMVYGVQTTNSDSLILWVLPPIVFPVYKSAFNTTSGQANGKQFITKLNPDLTGVIYSANFGRGAGYTGYIAYGFFG
jgi:hypothetical protein